MKYITIPEHEYNSMVEHNKKMNGAVGFTVEVHDYGRGQQRHTTRHYYSTEDIISDIKKDESKEKDILISKYKSSVKIFGFTIIRGSYK